MTSSTPAAPAAATGQSFRDWSRAKALSDSLARAEAGVRASPQDANARWLLFELLCVLGQWERALKQLQTWAGFSRGFDSTAHVLRGLIRAECQRADVFAGRQAPATVTAGGAEPPAWMTELAGALRLGAAGDAAAVEASDLARESALSAAPETPGRSEPGALGFRWISDSDSRLGPVCEVMLMGAYRWIPFADIASLAKNAPVGLLDLLWSQVDVVLRDGVALKGYMPMRYPVPADRALPRDALLLARETVWHDVGRTGTHAQGQKMWMTDAGDLSLLDLRGCEFDHPPADAAPRDTGAADARR
ncbi:type VI secretion system protein ImpE [Variovorax sp. TBS-050B]|uniref:type VI secretion system accessory protein TagJ n=1 Tax=Variovorax sp. TBS-050B TaxID=2940551 RepID=UPI0024731588|nr:type VI secretion system accessory protein TagJ [Variovorax sp. TBS-050B]MDH6594214.1 type VI secretion system protein ImpE [Variovorax sp. TBS-050B]